VIYAGSCHCGEVTFAIDAEISELTTCDCSLCTKKNALMTKVHEAALTIKSGREKLSKYSWNERIAEHFFCSQCGIYTFHRKRAAPAYFGINVFCLDDFDRRTLLVGATEGLGMTIVDPDARAEWAGPRATDLRPRTNGRKQRSRNVCPGGQRPLWR
jgi:hypothetical protein